MPDLAPLVDASARLGDRAALQADAAERGYLYLRRLVDPRKVEALHARAVEACVRAGLLDDDAAGRARRVAPGAGARFLGYHDPRWVALQREVCASAEFRAVGDDQALVGAVESVIGRPAGARPGELCRVAFPAAPAHTTPPHQDRFHISSSLEMWTAWLPLHDCPLALGPLAVLPGSHRGGLREHRGPDIGTVRADVAPGEVFAASDLEAGDAILFHCLTVHKALENRSADRLRVSVDFRFQPAGEGGRLDGRYGAG